MSVLRIEADPEKTATNGTDFLALAVVGHHKQSDTGYVHEVTQGRGRSLQQEVMWTKDVSPSTTWHR